MIPFIGKAPNGQMHRHRTQINGTGERGAAGRGRGWLFSGRGISICSDEHVLELHRGDGCTTLSMC